MSIQQNSCSVWRCLWNIKKRKSSSFENKKFEEKSSLPEYSKVLEGGGLL